MRKKSKWYYVYQNGVEIKKRSEIKNVLTGELKLVERHYLERNFVTLRNIVREFFAGRDHSTITRRASKNNRYNRNKNEINIFKIRYNNLNVKKFKIKTVFDIVKKTRLENRGKIKIYGVESYEIISHIIKEADFQNEQRKKPIQRKSWIKFFVFCAILIALYTWAILK